MNCKVITNPAVKVLNND